MGTVCDGVIPTAAETFGLMITFPFHICLTPGWIELAALSHDGLTFSSFFESSAVLLDGLVCYLDLLGEVDVLLPSIILEILRDVIQVLIMEKDVIIVLS